MGKSYKIDGEQRRNVVRKMIKVGDLRHLQYELTDKGTFIGKTDMETELRRCGTKGTFQLLMISVDFNDFNKNELKTIIEIAKDFGYFNF